MKTVNIHDAKTHLARLVAAVAGEPFFIARAGKPLVKVIAIALEARPTGRLDMLKGRIDVPEDFDRMGREEIAELSGA